MHVVFSTTHPKSGATLPLQLSHSTLTAIDACPRQWWLRSSEYEGLVGPYPEPVYARAFAGTIVHRALQAFSVEMRRAGYPTRATYRDIRQSFALRDSIRRIRRQLLDDLQANPRVNVEELARIVAVDECIEKFKQVVAHIYDDVATHSSVLAESPDQDIGYRGHSATEPSPNSIRRNQIQQSSDAPFITYAGHQDPTRFPVPAILEEVPIQIADPPLRGFIDLVLTSAEGDTLVDYKTGDHKPEHEIQSLVYAVLWRRLTGRSILERRLIYAGREPVVLNGPTAVEIVQAEAQILERIEYAKATGASPLPPAIPQENNCRYCTVRQMCDAFWSSSETYALRWHSELLAKVEYDLPLNEWRDFEVELSSVRETGDTLIVPLDAAVASDLPTVGNARLILTVPTKYYPGNAGIMGSVRLLGVGVRRESHGLRIILTSHSEVFWIPKTGHE